MEGMQILHCWFPQTIIGNNNRSRLCKLWSFHQDADGLREPMCSFDKVPFYYVWIPKYAEVCLVVVGHLASDGRYLIHSNRDHLSKLAPSISRQRTTT